jgi:hypothetical protein
MLTRLSRNAGRRHYRVPDAGMTVPNEIVGQCLENTCLYEAYYRQGPPPDWQDRFVSAYASAHSWEDWAETWAHYLHMIDTLEMAATCGLSLRPRRSDEPSLLELAAPDVSPHSPFDRLIDSWFPVATFSTISIAGLASRMGIRSSCRHRCSKSFATFTTWLAGQRSRTEPQSASRQPPAANYAGVILPRAFLSICREIPSLKPFEA